MKNIYSNIFSFNKKILGISVKILKKGNLVGLPTETVYGLAGNAYSKKSVNKIYRLKKRTLKNPLIVHYFNYEDAKEAIHFNDDFLKLYKKFCPGPITFILKKKKNCKISDNVTAKLNTVAIRFPSHKIVRAILKKLEFPLAMPSANMSTKVSPIDAVSVAEEFKKKLKLIINGGKSKIGIESTVIDLTDKPKILRPGVISHKQLRKVLKKKVKYVFKNSKIKSPGMLNKHYSPGIPVYINQKTIKKDHAFISFGKNFKQNKNTFNLSKNSNLKEAASNLYAIFRKIKNLKYKRIYVAKIPNKGIGIAINDRLRRASN